MPSRITWAFTAQIDGDPGLDRLLGQTIYLPASHQHRDGGRCGIIASVSRSNELGNSLGLRRRERHGVEKWRWNQ